MKTNEAHKNDFQNEPYLFYAIPLVKATKSWISIDDVGNEEKARELPLLAEFLENSKLYMTNADKNKPEYVKLYIVSTNSNVVRGLYVKKDILCPGDRYHHVTKN